MSNGHTAVIGDIAAAVRDRKCILFLGAGVHAPPPAGSEHTYPEQERPLIGGQLSRRLAEKSSLLLRRPDEDPTNLRRVSLDFQIYKQSRTPLVNEVYAAVQEGKKPSPLVHQLAQLDFPMVLTTNYDTHFEDACTAIGKKPFVSFYRDNIQTSERTENYPYRHDPTPEKPFVLKIHGDVIQNRSSIVITEEDYIHFVLRMTDKEPYHPVPRTALYFLSMWPTLMLGYSLLDYNLRLLFKTLRWRLDNVPEMYSVDYRPDPLVVSALHGQVTYVVEDVWRFVPALVDATSSPSVSA